MDPRWGSTRVENPAFSPTHETRRVSATNAVFIKDRGVVAGITIARTEKKVAKMNPRRPGRETLSLKVSLESDSLIQAERLSWWKRA